MKFLFAILLCLSSPLAFSGDRDTAYKLICKPLPFESDRTKCIESIKHFSYFNDEVLAMCAGFPFLQTKMDCLGFIGNKNYAAFEVDNCKSMVFESRKLECLRDSGTIYGGGTGCLPNPEVLSQLRSAQYELRQGQSGVVDKRLTYLISKFSNPSCN